MAVYNNSEVNKKHMEEIVNLLIKEYGYRVWRPSGDPISVLVQTILSQNTSDSNSDRAFKSLKASFSSWEELASADTAKIARFIRAGGLGEIKAKYIKRALHEITRKRNELELNFLNGLCLEEARDWLRQLPGVGMKTASCVLLFSLGIPALPVDTHIFRIAKRLGLIGHRTTVEQAHRILESIIPPDVIYTSHVLLIEHGRKICKAKHPHCNSCILQGVCLSNEDLTKLN